MDIIDLIYSVHAIHQLISNYIFQCCVIRIVLTEYVDTVCLASYIRTIRSRILYANNPNGICFRHVKHCWVKLMPIDIWWRNTWFFGYKDTIIVDLVIASLWANWLCEKKNPIFDRKCDICNKLSHWQREIRQSIKMLSTHLILMAIYANLDNFQVKSRFIMLHIWIVMDRIKWHKKVILKYVNMCFDAERCWVIWLRFEHIHRLQVT